MLTLQTFQATSSILKQKMHVNTVGMQNAKK